MRARLLQAWRTCRFALPLLLLRKLAGRWIVAEVLIFYRCDLEGETPPPTRSMAGLQIVRIDAVDSPVFSMLSARYPAAGFTARMQQRGSGCHVAICNGNIAGYAWVTSSHVHLDEIARDYFIPAHSIFIYDCFVEPQYRGCGIYPAMLGHVLRDEHWPRAGTTTALIAASLVNQASIRGIRKAGFREHQQIRYLQWGNVRRWWVVNAR